MQYECLHSIVKDMIQDQGQKGRFRAIQVGHQLCFLHTVPRAPHYASLHVLLLLSSGPFSRRSGKSVFQRLPLLFFLLNCSHIHTRWWHTSRCPPLVPNITHLTTNYNGKLWKTFAEKNMFIWSPHHIFRWLVAHKKKLLLQTWHVNPSCVFFFKVCVCVCVQAVCTFQGVARLDQRPGQSCFSYDELGVLNIWAQVHPS